MGLVKIKLKLISKILQNKVKLLTLTLLLLYVLFYNDGRQLNHFLAKFLHLTHSRQQVFHSLLLNQQQNKNYIFSSVAREATNTDKKSRSCHINYLNAYYNKEYFEEEKMACKKRPSILRENCGSGAESVRLRFSCEEKRALKLCQLKNYGRNNALVECMHPTECKGGFSYGYLDTSLGRYVWENFATVKNLQFYLQVMINKRSPKTIHGFLFLRCDLKEKFLNQLGNLQLLIVPPTMDSHMVNTFSSFLNFNLIYLDSLSRSTAYARLRKTIESFDDMNSYDYGARVLDFEMAQALGDDSFANLQSFFSGFVNAEGRGSNPEMPLLVQGLFGIYKAMGYKTLWLEDFSVERGDGIYDLLLRDNSSLELRERFSRFEEALRLAAIDGVHLSYAADEMTRGSGGNSWCFNGQPVAKYFFQYLKQFHNLLDYFRQPFVTFFGHRVDLRNVEMVDGALAEYVRATYHYTQTITIIFSDLGDRNLGRGTTSLGNPMMFVIVPENVKSYFDEESWQNFYTNQRKLTSLFDLYHTLLFAARSIDKTGVRLTEDAFETTRSDDLARRYVLPKGLFQAISTTRTCYDIPNVPPAICICQVYKRDLRITSNVLLLAEYAVGILNMMISHQYYESRYFENYRKSCEKMYPQMVENATETIYDEDSVLYSFVVNVETASSTRPVPFLVTLKSNTKDSSRLSLLSYRHLANYKRFARCSDPEISPDLCLCADGPDAVRPEVLLSSWKTRTVFGRKSEISLLARDDHSTRRCLFLAVRKYNVGSYVEVANLCTMGYRVGLDLNGTNVAIVPRQVRVALHGGTSTILAVLMQKDASFPWMWTYHLQEMSSF